MKVLWFRSPFLVLATLVLGLACFAQNKSATSPQTEAQVADFTVALSAASGGGTAQVFIPKGSQKEPAVVFSHSNVRYDDQLTVDLLPVARDIAEKGSIVIVVDRTLVWPSRDQSNRMGGDLTVAALKWLLAHANVDTARCAYVGPRFEDASQPGSIRGLGAADAIRPGPWVPLGEESNATIMKKLRNPSDDGLERFVVATLKLTGN